MVVDTATEIYLVTHLSITKQMQALHTIHLSQPEKYEHLDVTEHSVSQIKN